MPRFGGAFLSWRWLMPVPCAQHFTPDYDSVMTQVHGSATPRLVVYAAMLVAIAVYWPGLNGPFLLDDLPNLSPLSQWLDGQASAVELIFGNHSGWLGRPVSMATLWASAASGGMHPFPFKLGNLLIHLLCGLVGWQLLKRLLQEDPRLAHRASLVAALLAGLWLLHPIHVSTVLYAVQRMAQLSALFALAAVWVYVLARQQLAAGKVRPAAIKLFVLFPLLLLLGLFSKENAAVAVLLCAVVELAYFLHQSRPGKVLPVFYGIFVLVPVLLVLAALLWGGWDRVFGSYAERDFTLYERLLSQPRALWEYIGLMLWPRGGMMGVFVDDFSASTGLFSPVSTLFALAGLGAVSVFAVVVRRQAPSIFAGWFFFLAAHSIESTVFPLELYFEHRNYLPAFGIALAMAGLLSWLAAKLPATSQPAAGKAGFALAAVAAIGFAFVTWNQAQVWRNEYNIAEQALQHRPASLRAAMSKVTTLVQYDQFDEAIALTSDFIHSPKPNHRLLGNLHTLSIACLRGNGADPAYLARAEASGIRFVTLPDAQAFTQLSHIVGTGRCGPQVNDDVVADSISRLLDGLAQSDASQAKWLMRGSLASMYMRAERWDDALHQAELAWQPAVADTAIGGMLINMQLHQGDTDAAQRTLNQVRTRVKPYQKEAMKALADLQARIDAARQPIPIPPTP